MSLSGTTHLSATKPRSLSISDANKINAPRAIDEKSSETKIQDLNGVLLKRFADAASPFPIYHYEVENKRAEAVRVLMNFVGENLAITAKGPFSKKDDLTVEGILELGQSLAISSIEAQDKGKDFSYQVSVRVFPVAVTTKENLLEGVKFYTTTSYVGVEGTFVFEALNTKEFDIEVELTLKGELKHGESDPFKKIIKVGEKALIGEAKSDHDITTSWKWTAILPESAQGGASVQTSELQGVTLRQTVTPGTPATIQFEIINGREKKVEAEIDLIGGEEVHFKDGVRPLKGVVRAGETAVIGEVTLKGEADVNWKFVETD